MATETFFKKIIIDEEAADRLIAEMEKPREPYVPKRSTAEILRSGEEWWERFQSKNPSKEKKNQKS